MSPFVGFPSGLLLAMRGIAVRFAQLLKSLSGGFSRLASTLEVLRQCDCPQYQRGVYAMRCHYNVAQLNRLQLLEGHWR